MASTSGRHRTEVDARWARVEAGSTLLLHIATYGSDERHSHPKVSQVIQLDQIRARELKAIIERTFPGI